MEMMPDIIAPLDWSQPARDVLAFNTKRGLSTLSPLGVTEGGPCTKGVPSYSAFNVCDYTGDTATHVMQCRTALCQSLHIPLSHLVMPRQTHTARVAQVTAELLALSYPERMQQLQDVDALVTALHGVCIGVNTADCVNISLCDPVAGVIGVAHAGWRGTVGRIAAATVAEMRTLGAEPKRIMAVMGASICWDCFEVGDEVVQQFAQAGFPLSQIVKRNPATGKAHIGLQAANAWVLQQAGLNPCNIVDAHRYSRCHPTDYFSARRLGINSGRTFTGILQR